nr:hypothetical protein [Tanacetum cinerariifolium]
MSSFYEFICYGCGGLSDTPLCYLCTCEQCGNILINGTCLKCNSGAGNSFTYDLNPESFNEVQNISNPPPKSHFKYTCVSYVKAIPTMVMNVRNESRLSMSQNHISKEIYSNPLFDEEIISMKIDPHHFNAESDLIESLLNHDSSIISSSLKIDSFLDEFTGELILLKSIPPGIDETECDLEEEFHLIEKLLYDNSSPRLPKEFISENSDAAIESFSPSHIPVEDSAPLLEEIDLTLIPDDSVPPGIKEDEYDS